MSKSNPKLTIEEIKNRLMNLSDSAAKAARNLSEDGTRSLNFSERQALKAVRHVIITSLMDEAATFLQRGYIEDAEGGFVEAIQWAKLEV